MAIVKYNPLSELRSMQDKMNRLLDMAWTRETGEEMHEGVWQPPADIYEDEKELIVKMELPDLEPGDIDVRCDGGTLTIRGERKLGGEMKRENFHRVERYYGPFQRSFAFPVDLDTAKMTTACESGVLTVTIPKRPKGK